MGGELCRMMGSKRFYLACHAPKLSRTTPGFPLSSALALVEERVCKEPSPQCCVFGVSPRPPRYRLTQLG